MRVSKAQAEESRQAVITEAGRLFRERGLDGVGLAELMAAAGLTHGGFYKKFGSRDDLVRQAMEQALAATRQRLTHRVAAAKGDPLAVLLRDYLAPAHRDHPGHGCSFAANGAEAARSGDPALRAIFSAEVEAYLGLIEGILAPAPSTEAQDRAIVTLSSMVGALLLSRIVEDPRLSERILAATAAALAEPPPG